MPRDLAQHPSRRRMRAVFATGVIGAAALVPVGAAVAAHHTQAVRHARPHRGHHAAGHPAAFGIVVDWRPRSHTATIARANGQLVAVHVSRRVEPGTVVAVAHMHHLRNGTETGTILRLGRARRARIRGVVVADTHGTAFAIGARGTTFVVRARGHNTILEGISAGTAPYVGESVLTDVEIAPNGDLTEIDLHATSSATGPVVEIDGTLSAVDPTAHTMTITHGEDGNVTSYAIMVPASVDLSGLVVGQDMRVLGTPNPDGTYSLAVAPQTLHIEGTVSAVDTTAGTITVTTTDGGVTMTFVVTIPSSMNISAFPLGTEVELDAVQNADGTYSPAQSSDNGTAGQAEGDRGAWSGGTGTWSPSGASGDAGHSAGSGHGD